MIEWVFSNLLSVIICFGPLITLSVLTFYLLNWLFVYRQDQSNKKRRIRQKENQVLANIRCWLINDCPPELRDECFAYQEPDIPCWQHFRSEGSGPLMSNCLECEVFRTAEAPSAG